MRLSPWRADLSLDGVLARIVEIARELTGANYAALGVLNSGPKKGLRTFVHHGMDPVQVEEIGALPTGHGLLGLLIDKPEPLRLHEIASHPQSYGFPPGHPPMSSFLGVPVRIRDQVFGNLYLTEKAGGCRLLAGGRAHRDRAGSSGRRGHRERSSLRGGSAPRGVAGGNR